MNSTRGVAPMFPRTMGGVVPSPGVAIIDRTHLRPAIPRQFWAGTQAGAIATASNTPLFTPGIAAPIPGGPGWGVVVAPSASAPAPSSSSGCETCG